MSAQNSTAPAEPLRARYDWQLSTIDDEPHVAVRVGIPGDWASHLEARRTLIQRSLEQLTALAATTPDA